MSVARAQRQQPESGLCHAAGAGHLLAAAAPGLVATGAGEGGDRFRYLPEPVDVGVLVASRPVLPPSRRGGRAG